MIPLLLALTSGGLLALCHFPLAIGPVAWFALVPFIALVRNQSRPRLVYICAWLSGLFFNLLALHWFRVAHPYMVVAWLFVSCYVSLYHILILYLTRVLDRRTGLPLVVTFSLAWTASEFVLANVFSGWGWYHLGHTQHAFLHLIQISDATGSYGVSFLVAAVNALLFEILSMQSWFQKLCNLRVKLLGKITLTCHALIVFLMLMAVLGYGQRRLSEQTRRDGPTVALLKGTDPQPFRIRHMDDESKGDHEDTDEHFIRLGDIAYGLQPDLIVWPETSLPVNLRMVAPGVSHTNLPPKWAEQLLDADSLLYFFARRGTPILLGLNVREFDTDEKIYRYNSALLIQPFFEVHRWNWTTARYDKMHAVPLGEYVPLEHWLPFMKYLSPYPADYSIAEGKKPTRFDLRLKTGKRYSFGALICSETADAALARSHATQNGQPAPDFFVEISNDAWFDGTTQPQQHLVLARFRAIESRRAIARSVNYGVPAVVDSNGRVLRPEAFLLPEQAALLCVSPHAGALAALPWAGLFLTRHEAMGWSIPPLSAGVKEWPIADWGDYNAIPGVLVANMPIDDRVSIYSRFGDWLPWACWTIMAWSLIMSWFRPPVSREDNSRKRNP